MSQHNASFLSERLLRIFQKCGSNGECLKPFSKFPKMIQEQLLEQAKIQDEEEPIIACFFRHDDWVVLTTERLYWCDSQAQYSIPLRCITDATVDVMHLHATGTKARADRLTFLTDTGERYQLHIEAGQPLAGFWNVLKTVAQIVKQ
jgi:hypothetical protein